MDFQLKKTGAATRYPILTSMLALMFTGAIYAGGWFTRGAGYNYVILWLLGVISALTVYTGFVRPEERSKGACAAAWALLAISTPFAIYAWNVEFFFLAISLSVIIYASSSLMLGIKLIPSFLVLYILVPNQSFFNTAVSFPLRRATADFSVMLLKLTTPYDITSNGTDITIDGVSVTITAACSGIEQLEVMLLIGFLLVYVTHKKNIVRTMHFLMILPSLVIANVVRLTVTLILFKSLGDKVFEGLWHEALGWGMVILAFALLFLSGRLLAEDWKTQGEQK